VENLSFYFENRLLRGVTPPHILITGPSGSGKTATVKHVLAKHRVPGFVAYTVATGSGVKVLRSCASEVGVRLPVRGLSLDEAWERFDSEVGAPSYGGARRARQDARRRAGGPPPILPDEETEDVGDRAEQQLQRPQPREG